MMKIMTHNIFLLQYPLFSIGASTMNNRVKLMIKDSIYQDVDVLILNEAFDGAALDPLIMYLKKIGFKYATPLLNKGQLARIDCDHNYCWNVIGSKPRWYQRLNGGVMIFSKHNITWRESITFDHSGNIPDVFAAKGAVYARIEKDNSIWHVFGTHMQADDGSRPDIVRTKQITQILRWINSKNIPSNEFIVLGGDLNISYHSAEYKKFLEKLDGWNNNIYINLKPTWDPNNNKLVEYSFGKGTPYYLDHIVARNAKSIYVQTLDIHSQDYYTYKGKRFNEYSDHFPLIATIE